MSRLVSNALQPKPFARRDGVQVSTKAGGRRNELLQRGHVALLNERSRLAIYARRIQFEAERDVTPNGSE